MRYDRFTIAVLLFAALPAFPQMMGLRPPDMPGKFNPVVGAGAEYHMTTTRQKDATIAFAIVGQEDGGYWLEFRSNNNGQAVVMKELVSGDPPQPKRMIFQTNLRPPMEMPMSMMTAHGAMGATGASVAHGGTSGGLGVKIGIESITVPAGAFECEHYSSESNGKHSDVWISTKVAPYGIVKLSSADTQMELQKVLDHETSQIKGEPQKINIPGR